jgi:hypothetical protein
MMLLKTLSFFLDASGSQSGSSSESGPEHSPAVTVRLTSSAWEGWWDDADQGFPAEA